MGALLRVLQHVGAAHFQCHRGVWGAYRTSASGPVVLIASCPGIKSATSKIINRTYLQCYEGTPVFKSTHNKWRYWLIKYCFGVCPWKAAFS